MRKDKTQNPELHFKNQLLSVFLTHTGAIAAIFFIGFFLLASLWTVKVLSTILAVFILLIYGFVLYSAGYNCAAYDLKSYSKTTAYFYKGFYLSLLIPVSNLIVWGLMKFLWTFNEGTSVTTAQALVGNIIFVLWTFPYNNFMNLDGSHISVIGHILMYVFPVLCVTVGYFGGFKRWDISKRFGFLVYEKKKNK